MANSRKTKWEDTLLDVIISNGGQSVVALDTGIGTEAAVGMTLVRMILCYDVAPSVPGSVNGQQSLDLGIGLFNIEAAAANVVPDPNQDADYPSAGWIYRCRHRVIDSVDSSDIYGPEVQRFA